MDDLSMKFGLIKDFKIMEFYYAKVAYYFVVCNMDTGGSNPESSSKCWEGHECDSGTPFIHIT